jgi:hypothetical protein
MREGVAEVMYGDGTAETKDKGSRIWLESDKVTRISRMPLLEKNSGIGGIKNEIKPCRFMTTGNSANEARCDEEFTVIIDV